MKEEVDQEYTDCEEIIIHPKDYDVKIRKKLIDFLKKIGVSFKIKTFNKTKGMNKEDLERLSNIEMACCHKSCSPCIYPNCQRFVREQLVIKKHLG